MLAFTPEHLALCVKKAQVMKKFKPDINKYNEAQNVFRSAYSTAELYVQELLQHECLGFTQSKILSRAVGLGFTQSKISSRAVVSA